MATFPDPSAERGVRPRPNPVPDYQRDHLRHDPSEERDLIRGYARRVAGYVDHRPAAAR